MSDSPPDLNLILLPDWLKEPANTNPYADYEGESPSRERRGNRNDRNDRNNRQGFGQRPHSARPSRPSGGPDNRGPRPDRGNARGPQRPGGPSGQGGPRKGGPRDRNDRNERNERNERNNRRDPRSGPRPESRESGEPREPKEVQPPIPLQVDFVPEPEGIAALAKQIRSAHRAYPLYSLGRMFLNKPERHRVRITSNAPACPIYRIGEEGPISLNRAHAERDAFRALRESYYCEEVQQIDPPKGNFSNVARCRISGVLLGPTNHHGYQPALRRLYEARFSRRMDFNEFLRQIEVVNDSAVVEQWKTEASSITLYKTVKEETPLEFKTLQEVEAHFRANYLDKEVQPHRSVEIGGVVSRNLHDRAVREAVRAAWEKERGFPAQIVNQIRPHFTEAGLQIWKHRKRILFVSTVRPVRFGAEARNVSESVGSILNVIEASPKCSRADLSAKLIPTGTDEAEQQKIKAALASELHWLINSGHVIEFHDGTLDLPLPPKEQAREESSTPATPENTEAPEAIAATEEAEASETAETTVTEEPPAAEPVANADATIAQAETAPATPEPAESAESTEAAPSATAEPEAEAAPGDLPSDPSPDPVS